MVVTRAANGVSVAAYCHIYSYISSGIEVASAITCHSSRSTQVRKLCLRSTYTLFFFFSSRRRHTRFDCDWSSDVCSSDLAVICLPAQHVLGAAEEALGSGVKALCVISSGFAEVGAEGAKRQERLLELVRDRKSTRLNSSHSQISYAVFCLEKKRHFTAAIA